MAGMEHVGNILEPILKKIWSLQVQYYKTEDLERISKKDGLFGRLALKEMIKRRNETSD